jgi:phosphoribosylaminoimidazole-succinocarboxamide synthase
MPAEPLLQSQVPGHAPRRGKVRDVYDLGDTLAIVSPRCRCSGSGG